MRVCLYMEGVLLLFLILLSDVILLAQKPKEETLKHFISYKLVTTDVPKHQHPLGLLLL